ncbi:MAG: hypothetical protein ABIP94_17635 [Planctomycetota bacterium]
MARVVVAAALLGGAMAQQGQPPPIEPAQLPEDWARRDLEGKWAAFRAATGDAKADSRSKAAWAMALRASGDAELLEWIAVHEGWRHVGPALAQLDAPQLMRAAAWNLGALDSHDKDNAEKLMRERGAVALGWFRANLLAQRGKGAAIFAELLAAHEAADAARYLRPLDPMQVLVPWLDAPAQLVEFGARLEAEPKVRYVQQVLRALDGVIVFGDVDDLIVQKVLALSRHVHQAVSSAAFSTLSKLPAGRVPFAALLPMARDASLAAAKRQLATTTLSYSSHPAAFFALHEIAETECDPGRLAAVVRLGEIGDDTTERLLQRLGDRVDEETAKSIQAALRRIGERKHTQSFLQPVPLRLLLWRVAWLRVKQDPRAEDHGRAASALLAAQNARGALEPALEQLLATPVRDHPFPADEAPKVEEQLRAFVAELRRR